MANASQPSDRITDLETALRVDSVWPIGPTPSEELTVFVHGYARGRWDYKGLIEALQEGAQSDVYAHRYDSNPFCTSLPHTLACDLAHKIESLSKNYERLHLCGHSFGCLLIRAAVLHALEGPGKCPDFAAKISRDPYAVRITQLAGTNRGYQPTNGLQGMAVGFIHRWLWLALLMPMLGWWCHYLFALSGHCCDAWCLGIVGLSASWCLFKFGREKIRDVRLSLLFSLPVLWTAWGSVRDAEWLRIAPWQFDAALMAAQSLIVLGMGLRLGFGYRVAIFQGGMALAVAAFVTQMSPSIQWTWPLTLALALPALLYPFSTGLLLEHLLYGSAWLTGIRLHWLEAFASHLNAPPIVHLFGEEDRLVTDDDHMELEQRGIVQQIALRGVRHAYFELTPRRTWFGFGPERKDDRNRYPLAERAVKMVASPSWLPQQLEVRQQRSKMVLAEAMAAVPKPDPDMPGMRFLPDRLVNASRSETDYTTEPTVQAEAARTGDPPSAKTSAHVVFLIHGIRDYGEWQDSLGTKIREVAAGNQLDLREVVAVRYGYFNAFQFLFSGERQRATRTFLDLYTQTKARHPDACCHAAAHSNGTYVVGTALLKSEFIKIENLYLAGSVLHPEFDWADIYQSRRLTGNIRSDRAARDWPVGVLCWSINGLNYGIVRLFLGQAISKWLGDRTPWQYLGSGGVDGFKPFPDSTTKLTENAFLPGDHGEGLRPKYHDEIAQFLFFGAPGETRHELTSATSCLWRFGILAGVAAGVVLIAMLYLVTSWIAPPHPLWPVLVGALITLFVIRGTMAA